MSPVRREFAWFGVVVVALVTALVTTLATAKRAAADIAPPEPAPNSADMADRGRRTVVRAAPSPRGLFDVHAGAGSTTTADVFAVRTHDGGADAGADGDAGADAAGDAATDATTDASADAVAAEPALEPPPPGHAPTVQMTLTPDHGLTTGDAAKLRVDVAAVRGDEVSVLGQPRLSGFEAIARRATRHVEGEREKFSFEIDLVAVEPGAHALGPLELRIVTADGRLGSVRTATLDVQVNSLVANIPDAKPKESTRPVAVLEKDYTLAWIGGGLLGAAFVALVTLLGARFWRRRPKAALPPAPPRPPWDVVQEQLQRARTSLPHEHGEGRVLEWTDALSDAVRSYLGAVHGFDALESTSDEIAAALRATRMSLEHHRAVVAFLGDCDLVKFAKARPELAECERLLANASAVANGVRMTMPTPATSHSSPPPRAPGSRPAGGGTP